MNGTNNSGIINLLVRFPRRRGPIVNLIDWLSILFMGEKVGVLGSRAAGKTQFQRFIRTGTLPGVTEYKPTLGTELAKAGRATASQQIGSTDKPSSSRLNIRKGRDVPGDIITNAADWKQVVLDSDALLYLFDAWKLRSDPEAVGLQLKTETDLIRGFLDDRTRHLPDRREPAMVLIGTHCDLDPDYRPPSSGSAFLRYCAKMYRLGVLEECADELGHALADVPTVVFGSLATVEGASDLAYRVFKQELKKS